jgi:hypothetical protein
MTLPPEKFQRPKARTKLQPGRRVVLSPEDKAKYEALANSADQKYAMNVPVDRRKV